MHTQHWLLSSSLRRFWRLVEPPPLLVLDDELEALFSSFSSFSSFTSSRGRFRLLELEELLLLLLELEVPGCGRMCARRGGDVLCTSRSEAGAEVAPLRGESPR